MQIRVVKVWRLRTTEQRAGIVYVGRAFAGWPGHPLANPYRIEYPRAHDTDHESEIKAGEWQAIQRCLDRYRQWLLARPTLNADLAALWEECGHGVRGLGCWCVNTVVGLPDDAEIEGWPVEQCFQFLEWCGLPWPPEESEDWDSVEYREAVMDACAKLDAHPTICHAQILGAMLAERFGGEAAR